MWESSSSDAIKEPRLFCPDCGHIKDRDLNASKNIERWFEEIFILTVPSQTVSSNGMACGVDKPFSCQTKATLKQEVDAKTT